MFEKFCIASVRIILGFIIFFTFCFWPLDSRSSDKEIEALKEQIEIFQERVRELEKKQEETEKLRDRVQILEEKQNEAQETPKMKAYWKNGFRIEYVNPENNTDLIVMLQPIFAGIGGSLIK